MRVQRVWRSLGAWLKKHWGIPKSRLESWIWFSPIPVVEPKSTGGWGPKWASAKVFLDCTGNLPHQQQQQHRGLVPGFPNPLPLSEEEQERDVPSKGEPRFRCFYFSYFCSFSFNCPVFEWWCSIYNYAEPNMTEGERGRGRENNELGSLGEYLVFIESRVSGRGFCGFSTPNPFCCVLQALLYLGLDWRCSLILRLGGRFECETCQNVIWGRQMDFSSSCATLAFVG